MDGLKLPYGGGSMQLVLGEKARVLDPCSDATEKGKCGKGNNVCEKDIGRSHLPVLFGCEIGSSPRLGSCAQGDRVTPVVQLFRGKR